MILEYLCQQDMTGIVPGGADERPYFSPDSTALEVVLTSPAIVVGPPYAPSNFLRNGLNLRYFDHDDNIRVLSIGIVFPYAYSISTNFVTAIPVWVDDQAIPAHGFVGEFTGDYLTDSSVRIPYDGAEFPVDVTVNYKSPGHKVAFSMVAASGVTFISMINAPVKLDKATTGKDLHAWFFMKVVHTLPMVAG